MIVETTDGVIAVKEPDLRFENAAQLGGILNLWQLIQAVLLHSFLTERTTTIGVSTIKTLTVRVEKTKEN